MASIFTKIMQGELPSYKVYEDEFVLAILTIEPIQLGHTLVIPKLEVDHFSDVPEPYYSRVHHVAQKLSKAIHKATGCVRVGEAVIGLEVPHFHLHLIPLNSIADLNFKNAKRRSDSEHLEMQNKILAALN